MLFLVFYSVGRVLCKKKIFFIICKLDWCFSCKKRTLLVFNHGQNRMQNDVKNTNFFDQVWTVLKQNAKLCDFFETTFGPKHGSNYMKKHDFGSLSVLSKTECKISWNFFRLIKTRCKITTYLHLFSNLSNFL